MNQKLSKKFLDTKMYRYFNATGNFFSKTLEAN